MSFWDEYKEIGGDFMNAEEKQVLIDSGIPIQVIAVGEDNRFDQDRFVVTALVPDPESGEETQRAIAFPKDTGVESRDRMLRQMAEYLQRADAEPVIVKIAKIKRSIVIQNANEA